MDNTKAKRVTKSFTADWEKRNLPKMARALPAWVTPDHLTGLGLLASVGIGAGFILSYRSPLWLVLSIVSLFLHWVGDSLDGTLARVRKQERERYGYYVDRTADAISTVIICVAFGLSPYVSMASALLLAVGYLLLQIYAEICAYTSRKFPLSFGRMGPTEVRIALALFSLGLMFWQPSVVRFEGLVMTQLDLAVIAISAGLMGTFLLSSAAEAKRLDVLDRSESAKA